MAWKEGLLPQLLWQPGTPAFAGVYANNRASGVLRRDHPSCVLDIVLHMVDESYLGHSKVSILNAKVGGGVPGVMCNARRVLA